MRGTVINPPSNDEGLMDIEHSMDIFYIYKGFVDCVTKNTVTNYLHRGNREKTIQN